MTTLTVFTPTYNRAHTLPRVYRSLLAQSLKGFIWMIIDDGSTDNTAELVKRWQSFSDNGFQILYFHKENGGLFSTYIEAVSHVNSELMVCVDSDDFMTDDAVEQIINKWEKERGRKYAGIVGLDIYYKSGEIVGGRLPNDKEYNLIDGVVYRKKYGSGDRKIVVRTDLYKWAVKQSDYHPDEKYLNPHYLHVLISKKYNFLILNEPLCVVDYQSDGMSRNIFRQYCDNPKSFIKMSAFWLDIKGIPIGYKTRQCILYVAHCKEAGYKKIITTSPAPILTFAVYPFGILLNRLIKFSLRKDDARAQERSQI